MRAICLTLCLLAATESARADPIASDLVLVAAKPIARGAELTPADVLLVKRGAAPVDALRNPSDAAGRIATRAFAYGAPIRSGGLALPLVARRGEPLTVRAEAPGLVVELGGVAQLDGRAGAPGEALIQASGRRVRGTLGTDGTLVVRN